MDSFIQSKNYLKPVATITMVQKFKYFTNFFLNRFSYKFYMKKKNRKFCHISAKEVFSKGPFTCGLDHINWFIKWLMTMIMNT